MEIATDITERKEIEDELHESEEKFRDLFENSRDGIVIVDTATWKFVDSNETFSRMLGHARKRSKISAYRIFIRKNAWHMSLKPLKKW